MTWDSKLVVYFGTECALISAVNPIRWPYGRSKHIFKQLLALIRFFVLHFNRNVCDILNNTFHMSTKTCHNCIEQKKKHIYHLKINSCFMKLKSLTNFQLQAIINYNFNQHLFFVSIKSEVFFFDWYIETCVNDI